MCQPNEFCYSLGDFWSHGTKNTYGLVKLSDHPLGHIPEIDILNGIIYFTGHHYFTAFR
ncbi:MAG: hypothetical protein IPO69_17375 [Saprospiraceae bacterium]|nr:hypothetical protein [Saprospiraceae bacterium]